VKLIAVVVGLVVLVAFWIADLSATMVTLISVVWVIGLFGWAWVSGERRRRAGYIDTLENSAYSYSWRDRSPTIGTPGGYHYTDDDDDDDGGGDRGGGGSGRGDQTPA